MREWCWLSYISAQISTTWNRYASSSTVLSSNHCSAPLQAEEKPPRGHTVGVVKLGVVGEGGYKVWSPRPYYRSCLVEFLAVEEIGRLRVLWAMSNRFQTAILVRNLLFSLKTTLLYFVCLFTSLSIFVIGRVDCSSLVRYLWCPRRCVLCWW